MPDRSMGALLSVLCLYGMTHELLALLVHHCEMGRTGSVTLHTTGGTIASYELRHCGKVVLANELDKNVDS